MRVVKLAVFLFCFECAVNTAIAFGDNGEDSSVSQDKDARLVRLIHSADVEGVRSYLDQGGSPDRHIAGMSLMIRAVQARKPSIVRLLMEEGASIDWCVNDQGFLDFALDFGAIRSAAYLLGQVEAVPDVDCRIISIENVVLGANLYRDTINEEDLIKFYSELSRIGINLNVESRQRRTALDTAYFDGSRRLAGFFACLGVEPRSSLSVRSYEVERNGARDIKIWKLDSDLERERVWQEQQCS